jgi:hypothetical protein
MDYSTCREISDDARRPAPRSVDLVNCVVFCCECEIRFFTDPRNARRQDLRCPFRCRLRRKRECRNRRSRKHNQTPHGRKAKKALNGRRSDPALAGGQNRQPPNPSLPAATEQGRGIAAVTVDATRDPSTSMPSPSVESPSVDASSAEAPSDESPSDESPSDESPFDESPSDESPSDESPSVESPSCPMFFEARKVTLQFEGVPLEPADVEKSSLLSHARMLVRVIDRVHVSRQELIDMLLASNATAGRRNGTCGRCRMDRSAQTKRRASSSSCAGPRTGR